MSTYLAVSVFVEGCVAIGWSGENGDRWLDGKTASGGWERGRVAIMGSGRREGGKHQEKNLGYDVDEEMFPSTPVLGISYATSSAAAKIGKVVESISAKSLP